MKEAIDRLPHSRQASSPFISSSSVDGTGDSSGCKDNSGQSKRSTLSRIDRQAQSAIQGDVRTGTAQPSRGSPVGGVKAAVIRSQVFSRLVGFQ